MITREMFNDLGREEIQNMMGADLAEYAATVETIESVDELHKIEAELVELMGKNDEYIASVLYTLPNDCTSYNQNFTKSTIASIIADFISGTEQEYQYIPGLLDLVKVWKQKDLVTISYGAYDSTLRVLNTLKYKGYNNWVNICAVNQFMSACHADYLRDTAYLIYLADRHNIILDQLKKIESPVDQEVEQITM